MGHLSFDEQVALAEAQTLRGWDFSWLSARTTEEPLPWDYREIVKARMVGVQAMLDVGTGGGEFLSSLAPHPPLTEATEGYPPNLVLARERLAPFGIEVHDVSQAGGRLPCPDNHFDLVIDRHEGVRADELYRVLKPGGRYVTQQVGGENAMLLNRLLQEVPEYEFADENLEKRTTELEEAGLTIVDAREYYPDWTFYDVASVIFYLKAVPWQIAGFSVAKYRDRLFRLHRQIEQEGRLVVKEHRYLVEAVKRR